MGGGLIMRKDIGARSLATKALNLISTNVISKNLFNKNVATQGYYVDQTSGTLGVNANLATSDWIPVLPNTMYTKTNTGYSIAYYSSKSVSGFISGVTGTSAQITTPAGCHFIRYTVPISGLDTEQFELGIYASNYESFGGKLTKVNQVLKLNPKKNLFDKNAVIKEYYIDYTTGRGMPSAYYCISDYISVSPSSKYSRKINTHLAYYDVDKVFISGMQSSTTQFTTPSNCYFIRVSVHNNIELDQEQIELGTVSTNHEEFTYYWELVKTFDTILPSKVFAVVGCEFNIYFDNIIPFNASNYEIDVVCDVGVHQNERYTYIPVEGGIGDHALSIIFKKDGIIVSNKSVTLTVVASNSGNGSSRNLLPIGDSTTAATTWQSELRTLLTTDGSTITYLGTQGTNPLKHEGHSGWQVNSFFVDVSPFYNGTTFDFDHYCTNNSIDINTIDIVTIHLGINDVFSVLSDDEASSNIVPRWVAKYQEMVNNIHTARSAIKIALCLPILPSFNQDAFGASYGVSQTRAQYKRNIILFAKYMLDYFDGREASNIYLVPLNIAIDTVNNMQTTTVAINSRNSTTITRQSNGLHPAESGYGQMADAIYYWYKSLA